MCNIFGAWKDKYNISNILINSLNFLLEYGLFYFILMKDDFILLITL